MDCAAIANPGMIVSEGECGETAKEIEKKFASLGVKQTRSLASLEIDYEVQYLGLHMSGYNVVNPSRIY